MINQNSDVKEPRAFRPGRLTVPMHPAKRLIHSKTSVPAEPNPHSKPSSSMAFSGFRLRLHALSAFHKIFYSSQNRTFDRTKAQERVPPADKNPATFSSLPDGRWPLLGTQSADEQHTYGSNDEYADGRWFRDYLNFHRVQITVRIAGGPAAGRTSVITQHNLTQRIRSNVGDADHLARVPAADGTSLECYIA
jgi:hypothetical protein